MSPADIQYIIKATADPVSDASLYPGLLGAGRINAYKAVKLAQTYNNITTINNTVNWINSRKVYDDIVIESTGVLSIYNDVEICPNSAIYIKPGGKLILNGGTLTNACSGELWQGIKLSSEPMAGFPNYHVKGTVELRNGATIENAVCAISTAGFDNYASGGFIYTLDAAFINNKKAIEFTEEGSSVINLTSFIVNNFVYCK